MRHWLSAALLSACCSTLAVAQTSPTTSAPIDLGSPVALTFYLPLAHPVLAERKARSLQTPGSSDFHQFLSVADFIRDFGTSDAALASVEAQLQNLGYTVTYVFPNRLAIEVTTTAGNAQSTLGTTLRSVTRNGKAGLGTTSPVVLPSSLQGLVRGVGGLSSAHLPRPHHTHAASLPGLAAPSRHALSGTLVGGTPGDYLPADFASFYNVNPLYNRGFTGRGTTVGIVTLNNFDPADAFLFWNAINLSVDPTRITRISVDGGVTAPTNNTDGEGETDLDVEYAGAVAPASKLRVYIAPNITNSNFINAFEAAASENLADTVSTSWGQPELFYFQDIDPADPSPSETYLLDQFHEVFLEMALQGQTVFSAAGDSGAFDTTGACPVFGTATATAPVCNAPFAVDHPASDPLVTAAGGTTLPFSTSLTDGARIFNRRERAWAWDYIALEAAAEGFGADITIQDVFSVGGGGGVSSYFALPWYEVGTPGITRTVPGQFFAVNFGSGPNVDVLLPSNFAGRNLPDLSANADPFSGYQLVQDGTVEDGFGGTSFVAPQLNGVTALLVQALGTRVGQLNPVLYAAGSGPAADQLKLGDNWGYLATPGFDDATGLGTLDATKLLRLLQTTR